ncbi:DNA damage-induced apoptosis suppressor protein [Pristis pectinata]|uniref:DNA damage-induced apoptosis suppressor protein n=1 Tax=Pristis pectinata TaxID=685728 RepID=UPI00223E77BB|nr:DNA damage-induced apoptosis suppressor protein [Pristis pectinata]
MLETQETAGTGIRCNTRKAGGRGQSCNLIGRHHFRREFQKERAPLRVRGLGAAGIKRNSCSRSRSICGEAEFRVNDPSSELEKNHMNGKRSFVAASVLCLHDTCFLYPACQKCGTRLLFNHGRFQCPKRDCLSIAQNVNYRYRLSLKVAGKCDIFNITVFGSCLEPYFGAAAGFLNRYCEDLKKELQEPEGEQVQDLLVRAVEHCFIGRSFIFGVKTSESQTGLLSFSPSLLQSTTGKNKYKKHLIACQIAVPNSTIYGCTVINYYKKLVDSISPKDASSSSLLSASQFISIDQTTPKINSLSGCTQLTGANQLTNPWQQDFALTFTSGDCITVEEFSTAGTSRVSSKRSIRSLEHIEGATCKRKYNKRKFTGFATSLSQNSNDINGCSTNTMGSLPSSIELHRLPANESTHQYSDTSFELAEDYLESGLFDTRRLCIQKFEESNWKDNVFLLSDKSCSPLDCKDSILWDELPFSESLGEFIAKVEADLERDDEENALPMRVNAIDVAIHSCSLNKLKTDDHSGILEQKRRSREWGINSTKCKLLEVRKTRNKRTSYKGDSHNLNDTIEHLVLADGFRNDVTEKLVSPPRSPPLWTRDDTCGVCTPNPEAVGKIGSAFLSPINVINCSTYPGQTIQPKMYNCQDDQAIERSTLPTNHELIAVNKQSMDGSCALSNAAFQTPLTSAKWLLTKEENFNSQIQDLEHNSNLCNQEPIDRSQLRYIFKNENSLFQNLCPSPEEYDVSGELFSDAGGYEEEAPLCFHRNPSILSQWVPASKPCSKTTCKPSEQQCNTFLHCSEVAPDANQDDNGSLENESQKLLKCDFLDSQDYIPFSQSTPVSRVKHLKYFGVGKKKAFKMSPYIRTHSKETAFKQKQVIFSKNDILMRQSLQVQEVSLSNKTSVSSKSSLLDNSPVSKSYINDSDEWIPPSTIKTQIISHFSSCISDVYKSQGFELLKDASAAAMETTDSKITTEGNKEKDSSNQFRGHLCMKRTPAGNYTTPSLQQKVLNSTKVSPKRTEKLGPLVSREFQVWKGLKMNESLPTTFCTLLAEGEALDCYSPELFAPSTEFSEDESSSF